MSPADTGTFILDQSKILMCLKVSMVMRKRAPLICLALFQTTDFELFKLKQSADDNFKFDENSRKFPLQVENTVGKEVIARYEQFLLYPQCFQKAYFQGASKGVIVWEWVNFLKMSIFSL